MDLRTNPFQVGEDDMILISKETKETKEQDEHLAPEKNIAKKQLVAEENQEQESEVVHLHIPLGPLTRSRTRKLMKSINTLLHSIRSQLECAYPTTLVVIQAT